MYEWILPSLREVLATSQLTINNCSSVQAERQWRISLAATQNLLLQTLDNSHQGLVLAAPAPLFSQPDLTQKLKTITFTAKPFNPLALMPFYLNSEIEENTDVEKNSPQESILPLLAADPLTSEQFCLVFTDKFRLVLVLSESKNHDKENKKEFLFSFDPQIVEQAWRALSARVVFTNPELFAELDILVNNYPLVTPEYHTVIQFSQLLLQELTITENNPITYNSSNNFATNSAIGQTNNKPVNRPDVELLQAFAHEVRTPLTTIRMMTRLLLKKQDLPSNVISRLELIDHECTEQIDRMELLFKAAELETTNTTKSAYSQLTVMSLYQVLQQSIPRWQQAANKRNLTLNVALPKQLPMVVSNPNMLDRMLTSLIENFTRSLPPGSCIQVEVIPAGDQLKLQLTSQLDCQNQSQSFKLPIKKSLGQLLVFQPETGTISLNISATKHLFQTIGGKLIVRQRPQNGEVLTIFLPLEVSHHQL